MTGLDTHDEEAYLSNVNDHYIMVSITMPMYQNYALFTLGFSFFEKCLNEVSTELKRSRDISLALKDLHGLGLTRAKIYLSKVCGIEEPFQSPAWAKALLFGEMRNSIAHRCGFVDHRPDDPKSLYCRLLDVPGIELEQIWDVADQPDRQIGFSNEFVVDSLAVYNDVLRALWKALQRYPRTST